MPKKYCSSCRLHHEVDGGKDKVMNQGTCRWLCKICLELIAKRKSGEKQTVGRKPSPKEDYDLCDAFEDRQYAYRYLGISESCE